MVNILNLRRIAWVMPCLLSATLAIGAVTPSRDPLATAQKQINAYLASLADLHCTETVTQEKLTVNGHIVGSEKARYDYLIMMQGTGDDFELNETRMDVSSKHAKPLPLPMLVSNGAATILLVFHPYYRDSFRFDLGQEAVENGRKIVPVHFSHIPGRRSPAALALRGREFPLDLEGTAWLDEHSGEVVKIDAGLAHDMKDIGLSSLQVHVDYKPAMVGSSMSSNNLPAVATVEVTTMKQRWRNTHVFDHYKSFSTDVNQDPNVKIRAATDAADNNDRVASVATGAKEKP